MWEKVQAIRECANEIRLLFGTAMDEGDLQVQDQDLALDDPDNVFGVMAAVRDFAGQMVNPDEHWKWRSACENIISATRRAEELLQPFLLVEVLPEGSDAFTHRTDHSHSQAPPRGSATAVTGSTAEETRTQGDPEAFNFPEVIPGGETEAKMQALEHHLLELQNTHDHNDHSDIAATLHALGDWSRRFPVSIHQARSAPPRSRWVLCTLSEFKVILWRLDTLQGGRLQTCYLLHSFWAS